MANVIRIKRRLATSNSGTALPTGLRNAELAFNEVNNTLYIGRGGTNTEVNADGVVATPIIGEGAVWQGTATFGNVKTTGYVAVGDEAYAYTNTFPPSADSAQGGKLLASTEYVDSALARGTGSGMSLFPVAADVATTVPIVAGSYYDNLQGLGSVRVAIPQPSSAAAGLALYELKGTPTVQGVNLVANDRVLIMGHLDPTNIGIWTIPNGAGASTPWVREAGLNVAQSYTYGARVFVTAGDNINKTFAVASDPLNPTKDVGGPNFNTLSFIQHSSGATTVPAGANIKFKRVVRAKSDYYQIIAGKVVVDGVVLNQNDRFIWTPKNENPGGHNPVGYTVGDGTGDESGDYDSMRAGIYRVNYDKTLAINLVTGLPDFYSVVVRAGDFNDDIEAVAAHNTKVLVREGATNANKIFTITTNASSFIIDDAFPGEVALFGYDSNWTGAAGSLSGTPIIDGVQTVYEDLTATPPRLGSVVLVKNEVDQTTNGLYYIKTNSTWERHSSANETGELAYGSYIRVKYGTINKNSGFVQVANFDPLVIGTNPIVFESPQALLDFRAGVGLGRDGRSFYVKSAGTTRINVTEAGVDLAVMPAGPLGQSVETDPAQIGTAYLAVHADKYGRVLASSRDSLTADELRDKIVGVGATDDTTGTQHLVFSDSPALTGFPTAPTQDAGDNSTRIATTAYVMANGGSSILGTNNAFTGANTFTNAAGQTFRTAETADAIIVKGGGNTNGRSITLITDTLSGSRTVTFPDHTDNYTLVGVATTQTLTNKTLTAPKMSSTYIADTNNNELIVFPAAVTSAVNEITVTNAIASARPSISASGGDTNIDLALSGKGTGSVYVNGSIKLATGSVTSIADVNGNEIVRFPTTVASAVNEITVTNAAANGHPDISATGGDTNINLKLTAKGSGVVNAASDFTVSSGKALNLSNTTVTAGTNAQGQGALTNDINIVTSAATAPSGVTLPVATAGRVVVVVNRSSQANTVNVYPASGGTINALAANALFSVAANSTAIFRASSTTQWYSELVDLVNGTTGTLAVASGGTGATSLTNGAILKGAGTGAITTATSGTDYAPATPSGTAILKANNSGGFSSAAAGTDYAPATSGSAILKGNGSGGFSSTTAGTDYAPATSGTSILKGNNAGGFSSATAGTDFVVGGTLTSGKIIAQAAIAGAASLLITPQSATPTTLAAGDLWNDGGTLKFRQASATKDIAFTDSTITGNAANVTGTVLTGNGGTGLTSYTAGDMLYYSTGTALSKVAKPSAAAVLFNDNAGAPSWVNTTGSDNVVRATSPTFATSVVGSVSFAVFNTTSTTINAFGAATAINMGASTGTTTINHDLTVTGNLTINGTTTTVNTNTLTVEDKNIEIGNAPVLSNVSGTCGSGVPQITVTSTNGMMAGQTLTKVSGTGVFAASTRIVSVDSATQITLNVNPSSPGPIVFNVGGATDFTAVGGGVTIKGTADKTFQITTSNVLDSSLFNFTSSEHLNVVTGKTYKINDVSVLSSTTLGSGVTASSLTSVGTLTGGELGSGFTTVAVGRGGTGLSAAVTGLLRGDGTNYAAATAGTHFVAPATTTVGKIVTQAATAASGVSSLLITASTGTPTAGLVSGDLWNTSGVLKFYNGSATKDIAFTDSAMSGNTSGTAAGLSATLVVSSGGTGTTTFTSNGIIYGNGTNGLQVTAAGSQYQVLRAGSGGTPAFGAINLDQTAAVTGALPVGNGGTGVTTLTGLVKGSGASNFSAATAGTDYVVAGTATVGGLLLSTTTGITAAGTIQTDATALTNDINVVTTTAASTGVRLPAPAAGRVIAVVNRGANALKVYPATSTAINTLGNNAAFSVAANATLTLRGSSTTQWYAELTAESPCSLVADCTLDGGTF